MIGLSKPVLKTSLVAALSVAASMALAEGAKDIVKARQGYYSLLGLEMGALTSMVKGETPYDADAAKAHAANLVALTTYSAGGLYAPGTSNADLPGETRAMPVIWDNMAGLAEKGAAFKAAVAELDAVAGDGLDALKPAFGKVGGTCKSCHDDFRAKDF